MQKFQNVIIDAAGNAIPSVTVTVYAAGTTTPSSLFSDNGITAKANPYVTDAVGTLVFYAANGRYDIKLTKTGYTFGTDLYDTCLFDSADFTPASINESALNNLRLIKSGANLTLERVSGSLININGTVRTMTVIPTVAPAGLVASTLYYLYAYWTGTDVGMATSATGYTLATATGRAEMTGDTLYRLVGMAYTTGGVAWADTDAQRFVLSRDNRRRISASNVFADNRATASVTPAELSATERAEFLAWGDEAVLVSASGSITNSTIGNTVYTGIGVDGTTPENGMESATPSTGGYFFPFGMVLGKVLANGYHYSTIVGFVSGNTGTWAGHATSQNRCRVSAEVRG